ncbi:MAG TPA: BACON domain-containing carbohydrate-binding protein [Bacteroidales bacterium]|nr:BACON domain-containing carbohydrate-binding protein [Bacteroidales bacterium]
MKLKYLLLSFFAFAALLTGCKEEIDIPSLDEVKVDMSYIAFAKAGGSKTITLTATESWNITNIPAWLTVSPASGGAAPEGIKVTFTTAATDSDKSSEVYVNCAGKVQVLTVKQIAGPQVIVISSCKDVIEKGVDGKIYWVEGQVTSIANTLYGNWYLNDGTGTVYIYGTLDAKGNTQNFLSLGLAVGDRVMVHGPRLTYGSTIELVDVTVDKITPSLIKSSKDAVQVPKEGGAFEVPVLYKGNGLEIQYDADWLSVKSMIKGADDTTRVTFVAQPNPAGDRTAAISMTSATSSNSSTIQVKVTQKGAIIDATVAQFIAAAEDATQYRISGIITRDTGSDYGNIYIKDATGEVYIYGVLDAAGKTKQWKSMGIKEGDIVTLITPRGSYNGTPQGINAKVETHIPVVDATVATFLAAAEDATYYRLVATAGDLSGAGKYGNFNISDATGQVYVYGLLSGWRGASGQFQTLVTETGLKAGDLVTIVGKRTSYKGTPQVGSAFYVKHQPADA